MSELKTTTMNGWTSTQVFGLATVFLVLGVCGGMLIRRATIRRTTPQVLTSTEQTPVGSRSAPASLGSVAALPSAQELRRAADRQATRLLEKLKTDPTNATLLTNLGNLYYDAKQYSTAILYYERSLKAQPADTSVRTDMGTAYWYNGDADRAIAQLQKALADEPTKADTLFTLGVVEFQGKHDAKMAIATWRKLLDTNPGYENKEKVLQLIAQAQNH
jgi:cytochrome c-type biogenesis protein CcmH/NrfG